MLLEKTYKYIYKGKTEMTSHKMSPSTLKRAGVPDKLQLAYDEADGSLQAVASNYYGTSEQSSKTEKFRAEKIKALSDIESFLSDQELVLFNRPDMALVKRLLDSAIPANQIQIATGISRANIMNLKNGTSSLTKISVINAVKLTIFAQKNIKKIEVFTY